MNDETITWLAIRGAIETLPPDKAKACRELAEHFRQEIIKAGADVGQLALALVGAELAKEE
jgi:hypothetical protein